MIRAAIVGLGRWGRRLVDSVQRDGVPLGDGIRFTHAVVRTTELVRGYATAQRLNIASDLDAALADPAVDAIVLATPHTQHRDQVVRAAAARKPVFVEKPFALTKADAEIAANACARAGIVLAVGHNRRFLPALRDLKAMIASGALGTVLHVEANFSGAWGFDYQPGMWRAAAEESPAGGMTGLGIHLIDAFIYLNGAIASVSTQGSRRIFPSVMDDTTVVTMRFANGAIANLVTMMATARIWRLQAFGTKGWVHLRDHHIVERAMVGGDVETITYPEVDIERAELEAFADAIGGRAPYPVPIAEVVHGVAVMEASIAGVERAGEVIAVDSTLFS